MQNSLGVKKSIQAVLYQKCYFDAIETHIRL